LKPGCTILIAGCRQDLGRALAAHYAERGHRVFGLSRRESDFVHPRYQHICADVPLEDSVREAFAKIKVAASSLDVLIVSAGLNTNNYALLTTHGQAADMLNTNLLGPFLVTRHAVRQMKQNRFGRLIYLSSVAVPLGSVGSVMYGASKAGLEQMAFALSREFARDNITFNALGISIYPSTMVKDLGEKALAETRAALVKPEMLQLWEIVGAIDFFASDAARQITGQTLYFGGVR
jgi:3-oxoacyl-[acyl-carrier protein] reductase